MSKVAVVYWSGTGNTEAMAEAVKTGAEDAGASVDLIQAGEFGPDQVGSYDSFAFGCPAMGDEVLEDTEFEPMYDVVEPELGGKKVVLFGSYDWGTGEWMELWEDRAKGAGLDVVATVIANLDPDDEAVAACEEAGRQLA